jgi:hypothetical protein
MAQAGVAMLQNVELFDAGGNQFDLHVPDYLVTTDAGGSLVSALGTPVSLTAVKAVEGLPFEGEFVAGVQIGPEGIQMPKPATLSLRLLGSFAPDTLFGFAASDSGAEFHLVPIQVLDMPGDSGLSPLPTLPFSLPPEMATLMPPTMDPSASSTLVSFEMMHFSNWGVVISTIADVVNGGPHPPTSFADQTDDLLVPLDPRPGEHAIDVLVEEFNADIRPRLDPIDKLEPSATCDFVAKTAQRYLVWEASVRRQGVVSDFSRGMADSQAVLLPALKDCLKLTCNSCLSANKNVLQQMVVLAVYAESFGMGEEMVQWYLLTNKCAQQVGFHPPFQGDAGCGEDCPGPRPTTPALVCPK